MYVPKLQTYLKMTQYLYLTGPLEDQDLQSCTFYINVELTS